MHSQDTLSEPVEATLPGWESGSGGGTGSTTMSKSDTFQGPEGFRTPSAPGRIAPPQPNTQGKERHDKEGAEQIHEREKRGEESQRKQHKKEKRRLGREEKKLRVIKQGREISKKSGKSGGQEGEQSSFHARCVKYVVM